VYLTKQEYKLITKQWMIFILITLRKEQRISYRKIANTSQIPTSTLSIKLKELVKYRFIEKFVYGSVSKPHNVDYKITEFGMNCLNNVLSYNKQE
jgi:DNA-binding HxlR family transcriptional regulator